MRAEPVAPWRRIVANPCRSRRDELLDWQERQTNEAAKSGGSGAKLKEPAAQARGDPCLRCGLTITAHGVAGGVAEPAPGLAPPGVEPLPGGVTPPPGPCGADVEPPPSPPPGGVGDDPPRGP